FRAVRGPGGRVVGGVGSPGGADGGVQGGAVRGSHRAEPRGWPPPGWWTGGGRDDPLGKQATPEKGAGGRASRGTPGRPSVRRGRQGAVTVSATGRQQVRRERPGDHPSQSVPPVGSCVKLNPGGGTRRGSAP